MLSFHRKLYFPELKYEGTRNFGSWGSSKKTAIFSINWKPFDNRLLVDHHIWVDRCHRGKPIKFTEALPKKWETWLNGFLFAIPENYRDEIHRCSRLGMLEWCRALPFDTTIREMCMETAETYIKTAFNLIADCAYDPKKNYFYRGADKTVLNNVMLYRFWTHQTGRGLIWGKAGFDKIKHDLSTLLNKRVAIGQGEDGEFIATSDAVIDLYSIIIDDFLGHAANERNAYQAEEPENKEPDRFRIDKKTLTDLIEESAKLVDESLENKV